MADKKITDLTLISSIGDDLNLVGDDTLQTYRLTSAQLKAYIKSLTGLSTITPDAADSMAIWDASASNASKRALLSNFRLNMVTIANSLPYTVTASDNDIIITDFTGILTLPTAVGAAGKRLKFLHRGRMLLDRYQIKPNGSELISGGEQALDFNGSDVPYIMQTTGEMLEIESNGSNWIVTDQYFQTDWFEETLEMNSTGSIPTKGTASANYVLWKRENAYECSANYIFKGTGAGSDGTLDYRFGVPANIEIDPAWHPFYTGSGVVATNAAAVEGMLLQCHGAAMMGAGTHYMNPLIACAYDYDGFRIGGRYDTGAPANWGAANLGFSHADLAFNFTVRYRALSFEEET